jgi:hypothetical protein
MPHKHQLNRFTGRGSHKVSGPSRFALALKRCKTSTIRLLSKLMLTDNVQKSDLASPPLVPRRRERRKQAALPYDYR